MRDKKKLTKYAIIIGSVILVVIIALVVCLNPPIQKLKNDNSGSIPTKVENENQENSNTTLDNNDMVDTTNKNSTGTSKDLSKTDTNSSKDNNVSSNNDNTKNEDTEKNDKVSTNDTTKNNDDKTSSSKEQNQNSVTHNDNKSENSNENTSNDTSKNNESNNSKTENNSESNDSSTKEEPTPSVDKELENLKKIYRYETSAICYEESINVAFLYADNENFKHTACKSGAYKGQLIGYALLIYYKDGTTEYYMGN